LSVFLPGFVLSIPDPEADRQGHLGKTGTTPMVLSSSF
jgi:hypothetical protein